MSSSHSTNFELIRTALDEDLNQAGDITSQWFIPADHHSRGFIVARERGILSGVTVAETVFSEVDPELVIQCQHQDGDSFEKGDAILSVTGKTQSILTGERTALNFIQRLSGCASVTHQYVNQVNHTRARILDTRKTTPGWRALEKQAVIHGGGHNHRMGLFDAVMIKDNHLVPNPSSDWLGRQIQLLTERHPGIPVIIEADLPDQVESFLRIDGVHRILLDNMSNQTLTDCVEKRDALNSKIELEASGGVTIETVRAIAETGVDFISVGALTHSVRSIDFGLDLETI